MCVTNLLNKTPSPPSFPHTLRMLVDSCNFADQLEAYAHWINMIEGEFENGANNNNQTVDQIAKAVELQRMVESEIESWKDKVQELLTMGDAMIERYDKDDTSKIRAAVDRVNLRWNNLVNKVSQVRKT